jgi:putative hemolysin
MSITITLLIIAAIVLLSGFFVAAEVAALTARRRMLGQSVPLARFLPTIQVAATLLLTIGSAIGGATLTGPLSVWLAKSTVSLVASNHVVIALTLVVLGLAFVVLVFGQFVPRQLGRSHAETIARSLPRPIAAAETILRPLIWVPEAFANLLLRCLGLRTADEESLSVEDIEHLIRAGGHEGVLDPAEQMLARRALRVGDRTVRDIMRPRIEIDALDVDTPPDEVIGAVAMAGFSRLPIHEGDLDHIIGFVYTKDLLLRQHMGWPIELRKLVRPALLVPESLSIGKLLERFRLKRTQMALVLDEFGGTEGLVTMEDVLEELVGEIHDEHRNERQHAIVARDESSWYVDGAMPLHELLERLELAELRASLPADVSTVAGLVLSVLGRIPEQGESAAWSSLTLEVTAMEGRRLERVLIRKRA